MIPLRDDIPSRTTPIVNYVLIAICSLAFLAQQTSRDQSAGIISAFAMMPLRLSDPEATPVLEMQQAVPTPRGIEIVNVRQEIGPSPIPAWMTLITCMFLHGGWMHLIGNMLFLWVFGDNIEAIMGNIRFLIFYLLGGLFATFAHIAAGLVAGSPEMASCCEPCVLLNACETASSACPGSIPSLGASGAISAVLGAYIVFFPKSRIKVLIFFFVTTVPAVVFLGLWFVEQLISGVGSMGPLTAQTAGVAWWAHIGGFIFGLIYGWINKDFARGVYIVRD